MLMLAFIQLDIEIVDWYYKCFITDFDERSAQL